MGEREIDTERQKEREREKQKELKFRVVCSRWLRRKGETVSNN